MSNNIKPHIKAVFNSMKNRTNEPFKSWGRKESTIPHGIEPLITVQPKNSDTLSLKFIRSQPGYEFKNLLRGLNNYAKTRKFSNIELENDAFFTNKEDSSCKYRALIYRVFKDNKDSIYVAQGFLPKKNISQDKQILYEFTIGQAKQLVINLFDNKYKEFKKAILDINDSQDTKRFGEWLTNLDCTKMAEFFNRLESLAADYINKKIDTSIISDEGLISFLQAFRNYRKSHDELRRKIGGAAKQRSGARSIRRKSCTSCRKRFITRKTRKSRKYY